jgi:GNAT superfamily N-acetyltransferase
MNLRKYIRDVLKEAAPQISYKKKYGNAVTYSAVMFEDISEIQKITDLAAQYIPEGWTKSNNYHMTISQGVLPDSLRLRGDLNSPAEITINMIGISDKAIAFGVYGYYSKNEMPHITIAFNKGASPEDSNYIENWKPIDKVKVTGIIREVGIGNQILKESVEEKVHLDFNDMDIKLGDKIVGDFYIYNRREKKYLTLTKIEIYPEYQNRGYATQAMNQIIDYANSNGLIIILTPEAYKINSVSLKKSSGMSTAQLTKWYKSFGFIMNKGKQKDFEHMHLMYKLPDSLEETLDYAGTVTTTSRNAHAGIPAEFPQENDFDQFGNMLGDLAR